MIQDKFTNDRGQVGIGTLIVFIALVLVAAIAAGVLINTAGFLQTQAEQTGQDSTDQVADNINVIGEVGEVTPASLVGTGPLSEAAIYEQRVTVQRSPGSSEIDLSELSIQYVGDNGFEQLVHITDSDSSFEGAYLVQAITAETSEDAVITDDGDRYEIVIPVGVDDTGTVTATAADDPAVSTGSGDLTAASGISAYVAADDVEEGTDSNVDFDNRNLNLMTEGQSVSLEITTSAGATRNVEISAPDTFIGQEGNTVTL